jgi:hypothetical protein
MRAPFPRALEEMQGVSVVVTESGMMVPEKFGGPIAIVAGAFPE